MRREFESLLGDQNQTQLPSDTMYHVKLPKILQPWRCADLVRLGKSHDGGYLINRRDLDRTVNLITLGLGQDWSFEKQFVNQRDCVLDAYDGSPELCAVLNRDPNFNGYQEFFSGQRAHHRIDVGHRSDQQSLKSILRDRQQVFLKCDIEGSEYDLLTDLITHSHLFCGLIMEFHDINQPNRFDQLANFIAKCHLQLVHTHVNNYQYFRDQHTAVPDVLELTFSAARDHLIFDPTLSLPHELDQPNNPHDQEFCLVFPL